MPLKHLKYMNRFINFLATCKLFLQKKIFSFKTSFGLLISRKNFNVNYRKEKATGINQSLNNNSLTMNNNQLIKSYLQAFFAKKDREDTK